MLPKNERPTSTLSQVTANTSLPCRWRRWPGAPVQPSYLSQVTVNTTLNGHWMTCGWQEAGRATPRLFSQVTANRAVAGWLGREGLPQRAGPELAQVTVNKPLAGCFLELHASTPKIRIPATLPTASLTERPSPSW